MVIAASCRFLTLSEDSSRCSNTFVTTRWAGQTQPWHPFFALLGPEGCQRLRAVAMDMNTAYDLEVKQHCPNAEVVYALFHVVAQVRSRGNRPGAGG